MEKKIPDISLILKDKNISVVIKEAYEKLTPFSPDDFIDLQGAKIYSNDYHLLLNEETEDDGVYTEYYKSVEGREHLVSFEDSLELYAKGFLFGYSKFDVFLKSEVNNIYAGETNFHQTLYNLVNDITFRRTDPIRRIGEHVNHVIRELERYGISRGRMYKAWEIILRTQSVFEPYFNKSMEDKIPTTNKESKTSSGDLSKESGQESSELLKYEDMDDLEKKNYDLIKNYMDLIREHFVDEKDCDRLIDIILRYATSKPFITGSSIKIMNGKKTVVAKAFRPIHKKLGKVEKLKNDVEYLNIIKILVPFKNYSNLKIYDTITK